MLSGKNNPNNAITRNNLFFYGTGGVTRISGMPLTGTVTINTGTYMSGGVPDYVVMSGVVNYIVRSASSSPYSCPTGTYGNLPRIKVNIPAFQAPDTYSGIINFDMILQ